MVHWSSQACSAPVRPGPFRKERPCTAKTPTRFTGRGFFMLGPPSSRAGKSALYRAPAALIYLIQSRQNAPNATKPLLFCCVRSVQGQGQPQKAVFALPSLPTFCHKMISPSRGHFLHDWGLSYSLFSTSSASAAIAFMVLVMFSMPKSLNPLLWK